MCQEWLPAKGLGDTRTVAEECVGMISIVNSLKRGKYIG